MEHRIKELRSRCGWTQEQLSEKLGVSRQTVISIENGRYNPSLELAYNIAQLFRLSIEEVFIFEKGSD
ncbi:helix-turn-helix transcriptional regulator [Fictibacillus sp. 5RED26]|uniref:helix-turn-helix transcriptional regulator n=1 Tax=unclassified Fictibacillus TaxID=2644029 RepID=UPI0018CF780E|nr:MULTISPECIES: helix-turn-helix transcriptional regulator [unclassified Fictibacillus]MBH0156457.1 helix-turn-helix transcriptional regulator [Fictibacillus sp. 5RED26]MBH0175576.1 helix-turn-helix transcriptional regulator [Fictibacillus sp. 23RED33]